MIISPVEGVPIEVNVSAKFEEPGAFLYPLVATVLTTNKLGLLKDLVRKTFDVEIIISIPPALTTVKLRPSQKVAFFSVLLWEHGVLSTDITRWGIIYLL